MSDPRPLTPAQIGDRAGRAIGRVDAYGPRGLTNLSTEEIEALVCIAVIAGVVSIPPGTPPTLNDEGEPL